jgi:hydrogenase maturation protease
MADHLVLGLGNLLLGDDAVGLCLLEELRNRDEVYRAEFVDGGTQGLALLGYLSGRHSVLVLDAVGLGRPPGTVHVLRGDEVKHLRARRASTAHEGNALELLEALHLLEEAAPDVTVIGIEPAHVATGIGLSRPVEAALPLALAAALGVLKEMFHVSGDSGEDRRSGRD